MLNASRKFGFYNNFPAYVHDAKRLAFALSRRKLQQAIIQVLYSLNHEHLSLDTISNPSIPNCTVIMEFGIAEGEIFNYLDKDEVQRALGIMRKTPLEIMDFFCAVRYYRQIGDKNRPLKFDYYMLRLAFSANTMEVQVFHERGPRHIAPEDLINFLLNRINGLFPRKVLKAI
jgi:hypothetical protein